MIEDVTGQATKTKRKFDSVHINTTLRGTYYG
jgi:hypothetical protein